MILFLKDNTIVIAKDLTSGWFGIGYECSKELDNRGRKT
jgi:hypothetical protein